MAAGSSSPAAFPLSAPKSALASFRADSVSAPSSAVGSIRSSLAPLSTCVLTSANTSATRPEAGARSEVSSFMLSTTATTSPSATSSPAATEMATTMAGAGARTRPASPPEIRCTVPSTSTR